MNPAGLDTLSLSRLASAQESSAEAQALARGSNAAKNDDSLADLRAAANQFEALFVEKMLAAGRQAELAEGLLNNEGSKTFQSMLDREYAGLAADTSSLGIAEALVDQLGGMIGNRNGG